MGIAEVKRNIRLLDEINAATAFRIAYKTDCRNPNGEWVRLRTNETVLKLLAEHAIIKRLKKLVPDIVKEAVDNALVDLADKLNTKD